jgi:hypothetical protein
VAAALTSRDGGEKKNRPIFVSFCTLVAPLRPGLDWVVASGPFAAALKMSTKCIKSVQKMGLEPNSVKPDHLA